MKTSNKNTILVIDDCPENIQLVSGLLKEKYAVQAATNCEDALEIVFSDNRPDLILLDIVMPDTDGYDVIQQLKNDDRSASIPVLFLTAKDGVLDEEMGYKLGAVDYITKPIDPKFILQRIETLLKLNYYHSYTAEPVESIDIPPIEEKAHI